MRPAMILLLVGLLLSLAPAAAADSILTCTFSSGTTEFYSDAPKPIEAVLNTKEAPWTVILAGVTSDHPRIKGNMGEAPLSLLARAGNTVWLAESLPLGGLNVWTVFLQQKVAVLSKQYDMFGKPYGLMSMGRCR